MENKHRVIMLLIVVLVGGVAYYAGSRGAVAPTVDDIEKVTNTDSTPSTDPSKPSTAPASPNAAPLSPAAPTSPATVTPAPSGSVYKAKEFIRPNGYLNIEKLTYRPNMEDLKMSDMTGKKVILLNFWAVSNIGTERSQPYLNQWYDKYRDKGLEIVGIHAPRFTFEKQKDVILKYLTKNNVVYPQVMDNNFETWNAYKNKVWPYIYLIDINGNVVYSKVGEGSMAEVEGKIQALLNERSNKLKLNISATGPVTPPANAVVLGKVRTPELYFGTAKNTSVLANAIGGKGGVQDIAVPLDMSLKDKIYLTGSWNFTPENAEVRTQKSSMVLQYGAGQVYAVMEASKMTKVKVLLDGQPLGERAGADVRVENFESVFYISTPRIYHIVNDKAGYGEHKLEFITDTGAIFYTIIFG